jgi:two-component system, NtrC family, sensor kinase
VISLTRHHTELQDIDLKVEELSEGPLAILGDVNQIQQCFLNLIFNAVEAMPDGGPLTVSMGLDEEKTCARIRVRDSGTGIPGKNMDKIFDPFFTTKQEGQGTGLGLSITYGIVKGHDGRILAESEGSKGSTFTVEFPLSNSPLTGRDEHA